MSYNYKKLPPMKEIESLRSRIEVMEWDAISGEIPTYYAWEQINIMENRIEELQLVIADALIGKTRRIHEDIA